jgi:hypothetical protein
MPFFAFYHLQTSAKITPVAIESIFWFLIICRAAENSNSCLDARTRPAGGQGKIRGDTLSGPICISDMCHLETIMSLLNPGLFLFLF